VIRRRRPRPLLLGLALLTTAIVGGGCGGDSEAEPVPRTVDPALAPPTIGADLALYENVDPGTVKAFANPGDNTVVADGKVWEIRRADRLIGTLQIITLLPDADLTRLRTRLSLVRQILSSEPVSIRIGDAEVYQTTTGDQATFVWFGDQMMEVMHVRDRGVEDYEPYAAAVIEHQVTQPSWVPLPDLIGVDDDA
jgi:hypothetical protein